MIQPLGVHARQQDPRAEDLEPRTSIHILRGMEIVILEGDSLFVAVKAWAF
jgi:hypothetical protein